MTNVVTFFLQLSFLLLQSTIRSQEIIKNDMTSFLLSSSAASASVYASSTSKSSLFSLEGCFEVIKPAILDSNGARVSRKFLMATASDSDVMIINEWRRIASRCIRGTPYNELVGVMSVSEFFELTEKYIMEVYPNYVREINNLKLKQNNASIPNLSSIDNPQVPPTSYVGRGNYLMASIHQLEHEYEQLDYLISNELLPGEKVSE